MNAPASDQIIRSYLTIAGIYTLSASLIWGVNTLFLLDAGLDIAQVFIANAAFTAGMVIFEIPTGVLADTSGRRASFLLSVVVLSAATIGYVIIGISGGGLLAFSLMSILLGLGFTFYSGAVEAWLVDALTASGYDDELDHVFARGAMITGAAMLVGSVAGGLIGNIDLALPYVGRAVLLILVFFFAYRAMHDWGYEPRALKLARIPAEMRQLARSSVRYGWQEPHIRLLMIVSFIQYGFIAWAFYAWQPYLLELYGDSEAIWIAGVIAALVSVSTILGNTIVEYLTRFCGKRSTLMIWGVGIFTLAMLGLGLTNSFWIAVPLLLIAMGTTGVVGPVRQSYIHHVIPSNQRASVLSVDSMFSSGGGIVSQMGLGQMSQQVGIAEGYIAGGLVTGVCVPILFGLRSLGGDADVIIGKAGHQGACAAQGMHEVSAVDARPRHALNVETGAD
jgi:MFS family permease